MKTQRLLGSAIAGMGLVLSSIAQGAGDPAAGMLKAQPCLGCHGVAGYSNVYPSYHVPKVGGQHADYIVAALKAYQSGQRSHPTMGAQAATMNDQDMADIAAYFATTSDE